jgi:D-xylonolactonase
MTVKPELIAATACVTGENPLWHPDERAVYWTDIPGGVIYRWGWGESAYTEVYHGDVVGGFTLQADGALLTFGAGGKIQRLAADGLTTVLPAIPAESGTRFNDVIADPLGRVLCGTMPTRQRSGRLYRLDHDLALTELVDGIGISNGLGFSPDRTLLYYTDSDPARKIYRFGYDVASGTVHDRLTWKSFTVGVAVPDGLTVDAEGCVWSAQWDGGCAIRFAPDGREIERVRVPGALKVSNISFGGEDYGTLFITTAGGDDKVMNGANAGALFAAEVGVKGVPEFRSRIVTP